MAQKLTVALGDRRYTVDRPWGRWAVPGKVTDVATCSRGHVFVLVRRDCYVDDADDCVVELDPDGRCLGSFGRDRILDAHKIACDAQDRLWVVDRDAHEIVTFDRRGREIGSLGGRHRPLEPFNHPSDVAFAPDGAVVVADGYGAGRIWRFDESGRPLGGWGRVGVEPGAFLTAHGIWVLRDGRIVIADRENSRLQFFHPDGILETVLSGFYRPSDIWGDERDALFVPDAVPTLSLLDATGEVHGRCRPVLNGAHGLCGDHRGRIFLAEGNPSRLTCLTPQD